MNGLRTGTSIGVVSGKPGTRLSMIRLMTKRQEPRKNEDDTASCRLSACNTHVLIAGSGFYDTVPDLNVKALAYITCIYSAYHVLDEI
eukprot:PDM60172.1 hypothetical protein PRIPAC_53997 [Pristionchus pacificus]